MAAAKKGQLTGFLKGMNFIARMNEVAILSFVQKAIDNEEHKKLGYDSAREFVKDELGIHYDTFRDRVNALQKLGPEINGILVSLDLHWRDVRMIEHMMTDDQKAAMKKGVLDLGERKIPINEEHAEEVRNAFANMKETADLARKAERIAEKKLAGIDGEVKKSEKALLKKIADLEAIAGTPDTPEKVIKGFEKIDQAFSDLETMIRVFCWKDAKKMIAEDPALQAKVEGIQRQMQSRCEGLIRDWDAEINNGGEE